MTIYDLLYEIENSFFLYMLRMAYVYFFFLKSQQTEVFHQLHKVSSSCQTASTDVYANLSSLVHDDLMYLLCKS